MKTDKLNAYEGRLNLPIGTPYVLVSSWEDNNRFFTEALTILNCLNGKYEIALSFQPFQKGNNLVDGTLITFNYVQDYGYSLGYRNISKLIYSFVIENENISFPNYNDLNLNLIPSDRRAIILKGLFDNAIEAFDWLEKNTASELLKALMQFIRNLDIETYKTFPSRTS